MEEQSKSTAWLWSFLRPMRKTFAEMLAMSVFVNLVALAVPVFTLQVYDRVIFSAGYSTLQGLVIGVVLIVIFEYAIKQSRSRVLQKVALRTDIELGRRLFDKVASLPLQKLEANASGYWQSLFRDMDLVRNTLSGAPALLFVDLPFTLLFFAIIYIIAKPIILVLMVIWALYIFIAWRSSTVMRKANEMERQATQGRDTLVSEMIQGRTTVKALGLDRAIRPIWEEAHADNIEKAAYRGSKVDSYSNIGSSLSMVTTIGMTTFGAIAIINQELTMGALIAANMLSGRLLGPLNQLVGTWRVYSSFNQAAARLGEVFAAESDRTERTIAMERPKGDIAIEDVTFAYEEGASNVVDGIKIGIRPGGLHAIVGRNGSGKTTLIKLIQGLYKPTSGRILLDGADIAQFSRTELVSWIGYVPQETVLFAGTVRDNIAYGWPDATDEEIIDAATAAGVHRFIIDLPDGYGSEIGEAGQRLSGGQRQRISIARALVGNPAVLLLDEPSANLDRQAEEELRSTLRDLSKEHTVIVVTHSPVMLQGCDNLIAVDKGKVAVAGPAKEILPKLFGSRDRRSADAPAKNAPRKPSAKPPQTAKKLAAPGQSKPAKPRPGIVQNAQITEAVVSEDDDPDAKSMKPIKSEDASMDTKAEPGTVQAAPGDRNEK